MGKQELIGALLDRHGGTYAQEVGIDAASGHPDPLFGPPCAATLMSARINAGIAVQAARNLAERGWRSAAKLAAAAGRSASRHSTSSSARPGSRRSSCRRSPTAARSMPPAAQAPNEPGEAARADIRHRRARADRARRRLRRDPGRHVAPRPQARPRSGHHHARSGEKVAGRRTPSGAPVYGIALVDRRVGDSVVSPSLLAARPRPEMHSDAHV
jgi:hypothetical protein